MSEPSAPTIETVAIKAGVSISTVSRALRNDSRISAKTIERVKAAAAAVGYRPNPLISALMSHLRTTKPAEYQSTVAYLETAQNLDKIKHWTSSRQHFNSVRDRASQLGYGIDHFWFFEPDTSPKQLVKILLSRGIQGIILHYLPTPENELHELPMDLSQFAVAALGSKLDAPRINYACTDHFAVMQTALQNLAALGYRRIGVAIDSYVDNIVEGRFLGAYLRWADTIPAEDRVPHFVSADFSEKAFAKWFRANKPQAVICIDSVVMAWLEALKVPVPGKVGVVHLDLSDEVPGLSGVRQRHDLVAYASFDLIVGQLHRNERGPQDGAKAVLIGGEWVDGKTIRNLAEPAQTEVITPKRSKGARRK